MPVPEWSLVDHDPTQRPHTASEIIGRGTLARKSKTYIKDLELASLFGRIGGYIEMLLDLFRELHERETGDRLTDKELMDLYPAIRDWSEMHQEHVDHYASIDGFSVKRVTGTRDDAPEGERRSGSSAGADGARNGEREEKWR